MTNSALLVIDAQVAILDGAWRAGEVLDAIADLQRRAREAGAPVVFLQHSHVRYAPMMKGAPGWAIHPRVAPAPGEVVIDKRASDGFLDTSLQGELDRLGVRRLVVCGLQTEFCVDATCRAALSRGFDVVLAADAHTTGDAVTPAETTIRHHNYVLANLAHPDRAIAVVESGDVGFG
ncbi:MAG: cysteine hydrolase family protein [Caulobacterales bacterium]